MQPRNALLSEQYRQQIKQLPAFYQTIHTGARLAHRFGMRHIESLCYCRADDETLEHLFFECELARILVAWVYFNLYTINPTASRFTVEELLFGFSEARR